MTANAYVDACGFVAASAGTGDFVVSAAVLGYQTPATAVAVNAAVYSYRAESADKTQWEEGFGAYTVGTVTLARTTVTTNNLGTTAKINFSLVPNVFIVALSADLQNASLLTSGTIPAARLPSTPITNSLGADVTLNNTGTYFDGPSVAQGTSGTWFASGTVTITDTATGQYDCKLWDGTTVVASTRCTVGVATAATSISLSGFLTSPAANLKISVKPNTTTATMRFNQSGNSKDSTLTAFRIA